MNYNKTKKIFENPEYHVNSLNGVWLAFEGNVCWAEESLLIKFKRPLFCTKKYVFFDTFPDESEKVRFRFAVESVDDKVALRVEELAKVNETIDEHMLKTYFEDRKQKIGNRQQGNFDVIIDEEMINQEEFMLRYSFLLDNIQNAIFLQKSIYKGVMKSIGNYFS